MAKENEKMQMPEISLKNRLERDLKIDGIVMKKDSARSSNFTLNFPVPKKDLAGRSRVEKAIENFYSSEDFEMGYSNGVQIARNKENNEAYLIGIVKDTPYNPGQYSIRVAKTEKPGLFYQNKE